MQDFPGDPPGPLTLVVRAVFVPDGEEPPAEFLAVPYPLRVRATYDPETGVLTCEDTSGRAFAGIPARWYPDNAQDDNPFADDDDNGGDGAGDEGDDDGTPAWARGLLDEPSESENRE